VPAELHAKEHIDIRQPEVRVHEQHALPEFGEQDRQVHGDGGLPHPTLAARDGNYRDIPNRFTNHVSAGSWSMTSARSLDAWSVMARPPRRASRATRTELPRYLRARPGRRSRMKTAAGSMTQAPVCIPLRAFIELGEHDPARRHDSKAVHGFRLSDGIG